MKNWDTPVLSPFLSELIVLEMRFRRGTAAPIEREFIRTRENIGAVIIYAERNIAHQRNAAAFGVCFNRGPLFACNPLDVTEKIFTTVETFFLFRRLSLKPCPR